MIGKLKIGKDLEESGCKLFIVLFRNFPGDTEKNHERLQPGYSVSSPRFGSSISRTTA
jgi:hypothetical protein